MILQALFVSHGCFLAAFWRHLTDLGCPCSVGATADTFGCWQVGNTTLKQGTGTKCPCQAAGHFFIVFCLSPNSIFLPVPRVQLFYHFSPHRRLQFSPRRRFQFSTSFLPRGASSFLPVSHFQFSTSFIPGDTSSKHTVNFCRKPIEN